MPGSSSAAVAPWNEAGHRSCGSRISVNTFVFFGGYLRDAAKLRDPEQIRPMPACYSASVLGSGWSTEPRAQRSLQTCTLVSAPSCHHSLDRKYRGNRISSLWQSCSVLRCTTCNSGFLLSSGTSTCRALKFWRYSARPYSTASQPAVRLGFRTIEPEAFQRAPKHELDSSLKQGPFSGSFL